MARRGAAEPRGPGGPPPAARPRLTLYDVADRLLFRPLGPELAHKLALAALALRFSLHTPKVNDPYPWRGLVFPNRVGVAAGFDKNAAALTGLAEIGAGFAEIGTILTRPWPGNALRPRMARLEAERGLWNRLGFPSIGLRRVARRFAEFRRSDILLGCNVAPHPLTLRTLGEPGFAARARAELDELVTTLHPWAKFFVINMSSPNTSGLRGVLHGEGFAQEIVAPIRARIQQLARAAGQKWPTPLLVKLPPETPERAPWTAAALRPLVAPLAQRDVCDGFVAVNTSIGLALQLAPQARADAPGGVSGRPLFAHALAALRALVEIARHDQLRIGVGGITTPEDAVALVDAGAQLVELYSAMIYQGPTLLWKVAAALQEYAAVAEFGLPPRHERVRP